MLGKLLKYELKASARTLLPLYVGTLVVAVICAFITASMIETGNGNVALFGMIDGEAPLFFSSFVFLLFFGLCVATVVLTIMIVIQRFNKNLIGDEGYLMFTLPVSHMQLLGSKLLVGIAWLLLGTVVMLLSGVIIGLPVLILLNAEGVDWAYFWNEVQYLLSTWDPLPFIASSLDALCSMAAFILVVYLSIMIGQMEQFNKHRMAVSVLLFFLINWAFSLVETTILNLFGVEMYGPMMVTTTEVGSVLSGALTWIDFAFTTVQCALCFAAIVWLMKKKLNL